MKLCFIRDFSNMKLAELGKNMIKGFELLDRPQNSVITKLLDRAYSDAVQTYLVADIDNDVVLPEDREKIYEHLLKRGQFVIIDPVEGATYIKTNGDNPLQV
jgi:hypothetical protein